jgi:hypothetical protein
MPFECNEVFSGNLPVSEMLEIHSILTWLIAQWTFFIPSHHESLKSHTWIECLGDRGWSSDGSDSSVCVTHNKSNDSSAEDWLHDSDRQRATWTRLHDGTGIRCIRFEAFNHLHAFIHDWIVGGG